MAKKRKGKKKSHRRRRVGAVHPALMQMATHAGGIIAGGVAAAFVNSAVKKSMATAPAFTGGAIAVVAGMALPMFVKGNQFVASMSDGLIAAGGLFVLNETFLSIPGISGLPVMPGMTNARPGYLTKAVGRMPRRRVGSLDSLKVIGQLTDN